MEKENNSNTKQCNSGPKGSVLSKQSLLLHEDIILDNSIQEKVVDLTSDSDELEVFYF